MKSSKKLACRKRPLTSISFVMDKPTSKKVSSKLDLSLAIRALENEDPNSLLALVAKWRLRTVLATEGVDDSVIDKINKVVGSLPAEQSKTLFMVTMANVLEACAKELEEVLEKRGFNKEI